MRSLDEIRKDVRAEEQRIECIRSDMRREPVRVEREHLASLKPWQDKLARLRHKRTNGRALLETYDARVAELEAELSTLRHRDGIARLLKLVKQVNAMNGVRTDVDAVIEEGAAFRERVLEIKMLLRAYANEIEETRRAMAGDFEQQEARCVDNIVRREKWFSEFCMNRIEGPQRIAQCVSRIDELHAEETVAAKRGDVRRLEDTMAEVARLMSELGAEKVAAVLGR